MESSVLARPVRATTGWARCRILGHRVDNRAFARDRSSARSCPCGAEILGEDATETHVGHVFGCFFLGHTYARAGERDGHVELVCERCGHPLVVEAATSWALRERFWKPVRYLCGVAGHRVHEVAGRNGYVEYACHCGHSFLSAKRAGPKIHHPAACVLTGHKVGFVERRFGLAEFRCGRCGHPFCFAGGR